MSHAVTAFSVSLAQVRNVIGCRSKSLLKELREEFEEELQADREEVEEANANDEFDPALPLSKALRHLIMEEERWDYEGPKYGYAIQMLCTFYGEVLPNEHWSEMQLSWAETIHDALIDAGVASETFSIFDHLIDRGSPINIPDIEDFPYIGYITTAEIPIVLSMLTENRFAAIDHPDATKIRTALEQVREWLETCLREKSDLVCFCY